jgi:hypothetical protein
VPDAFTPTLTGHAYLKLDESVAEVHDRVRTAAVGIDPLADTVTWAETKRTDRFNAIRTGLLVGAACMLATLGGAVAAWFGTRRSATSASSSPPTVAEVCRQTSHG